MRKKGVSGETGFWALDEMPMGCKIQFWEGSSMTLFSLRHLVFEKTKDKARLHRLSGPRDDLWAVIARTLMVPEA